MSHPLMQFEGGLPAVVLAPLETSGRAAALLIDVAAGQVLAANSRAAAVLGLSPGDAPPFDAAMPALAQIRLIASGGQTRADAEALLFWTRSGTVRLTSSIQVVRAGQRTLAIIVGENVPAHVSPPHAATPELFAGDDAAKLKEIARRIREGQQDGRSERPASNGAHTSARGAAKPVTPKPGNGSALPDSAPSPALRASLAHELKTPISAIAAAAEIMKAQRFGPLGTSRYVGYAADIHGSAQHVLGVIDRMLAEGGAALDSSPGALDFTQIDISELLDALVSQMAPLAEQAGVSINLKLPARPPHLVADATSVRQIVVNLLTNALKFTEPGGRIAVEVRCDGDGPLEIAVKDSGAGIAPEDLASLRQRKKAPRDKLRAGDDRAGLGLGLPLVQTLAAANGGELQLDSVLGEGTSAVVVFRKDRVIPV